jgi:two-component system cell cycle sensor histidine kinase/response regulator CckA
VTDDVALAERTKTLTAELERAKAEIRTLRAAIETGKRAEDALRESENRFRVLANGAPVVLFVNDTSGGVQFVNRSYCEYFGITPEQVEGGKWKPLVHPDDTDQYLESFLGAVQEQAPFRGELRVRRGDGAWRSAETIAEPRRSSSGEYLGHVGIITDLTEQKEAERERVRLQDALFNSQKLESVGRLAGGVAHDFNNMLAIILGNLDLALLDRDADPRGYLVNAHDAAQRSARLTGQLLAFARRQPIVPRPLDINMAMTVLVPILTRLIGENIQLVWQPNPTLWNATIDSTQFDQMLTNLCINARDAISTVGQVHLFASNTRVTEAYRTSHGRAVPGEYVRVVVRDDGSGMNEEEMRHLFEPFFSTKRVGDGSGLALATVYGAVQQNNGFLEVTSAPGAGTTFEIFLPRLVNAKVSDLSKASQGTVVSSEDPGQTILVVEDEPVLSRTVTRMLEASGFQVLAATSPREAIRVAAVQGGAIDLLLTDVIMPEMNGLDLADKLRSMVPGLNVLYMSGYTADIITEHTARDPNMVLIDKPFSMEKLTSTVRGVLQGAEENTE